VKRTGHQDTLSLPPVRGNADGEVALANLLRIGSGLGARAARVYSRRESMLDGVLLGFVLVFGMMLLASLL